MNPLVRLAPPLFLLCSLSLRSEDPPAAAADEPMVSAARALAASLTPEHRPQTLLAFDSADRTHWMYVPGTRSGLSLKEMTDAERRATHSLLRSALSSRGYLKATAIMDLESVLRVIEGASHRDSELYWVAIFGQPDESAPWGWRFEGHHLSLNFTCVGRSSIVATPAFFGSNPAEVKGGRSAGLRVLAAEEDLGYQLLRSLDADQRARAVVSKEAPVDILMKPDRSGPIEPAAGVAAREMSDAQREVLIALIVEFTHNLRRDLAEQKLQHILDAELPATRFSWRGPDQEGQPHYFRVQGTSFVIELDNVQNDANHVHAVWSELNDEFGMETLRRHYQREHGGR